MFEPIGIVLKLLKTCGSACKYSMFRCESVNFFWGLAGGLSTYRISAIHHLQIFQVETALGYIVCSRGICWIWALLFCFAIFQVIF
jgi:hypothetical protein